MGLIWKLPSTSFFDATTFLLSEPVCFCCLFIRERGVSVWLRMATKVSVRSDEGLMMMQELDDRLKEQIDKLEHVRLAAVELKDNLSDVRESACHLSSRLFIQWPLTSLFSSDTEPQWSNPVCRWASGMVESLVGASGDSSHEHSSVCSGRKWVLLCFYILQCIQHRELCWSSAYFVFCIGIFANLCFICFQMNPKPRAWAVKQGTKHGYRWGRFHQAEDAQSEFGWSPIRTRRNSDAASEMSCNWWSGGPPPKGWQEAKSLYTFHFLLWHLHSLSCIILHLMYNYTYSSMPCISVYCCDVFLK